MKLRTFAILACVGVASVACAQPAAEDLGTLSVGTTSRDLTMSSGAIFWYKFTLSSAVEDPSAWLDMFTTTSFDSEFGVYDSAGNLMSSDDDSGPGLQSLLSFGAFDSALPGRTPAPPGGIAFNGNDGALPAGEYYLAVTGFNATFNTTNWDVQTTHGQNGPISFTMYFGSNDALGVIGDTQPDPVDLGATITFSATVNPGRNPDSTGITVTVDASPIGLASDLALFDDGMHNDGSAGDNLFANTATVPATASLGNATVTYTARDAQSRSASDTDTFRVRGPAWDENVNGMGDAGDLPSSAQTVTGTGTIGEIAGTLDPSSADMYRINICNPGSFSASTVDGAGFDTQLFLFNLNGTGIVHNDDNPAGGPTTSFISNAFAAALPAGDYLLAISGYNHDPLEETGALIWANTPFRAERAPDGPGLSGAVTSWLGTGGGGNYTIFLSGACYSGGGGGCTTTCDYNADGGPDLTDIFELANDIASGTSSYPSSCKDFNGDGSEDLSDFFDLANAIASATCP